MDISIPLSQSKITKDNNSFKIFTPTITIKTENPDSLVKGEKNIQTYQKAKSIKWQQNNLIPNLTFKHIKKALVSNGNSEANYIKSTNTIRYFNSQKDFQSMKSVR
ncbi:hypothetical protein ABPG74_019767 [Tetrahymena malaccensis]